VNNESLTKIFETIKDSGERGLDDATLAELVGMPRSTVSNLRRELVRQGLVKCSPAIRRGLCGRLANIWVSTGRELD
jgi:DNA-binding IclR family transcriptional regulator